MWFHRIRARSLRVTAALAGIAAVGACDQKTVVDLTEGDPILRVSVAPGEAVLPSGSVALSNIRISDFDFTVTDGFSRGVTPEEAFVSQSYGSGTWPGLDVAGGFRNSSQDVRAPRLVESEGGVGGFYAMWGPEFLGADGLWNLWGEVSGLKPNTQYTIVMARMALEVRGELDQNQILTGRTVSEPDSLYFLGGSEGGTSTLVCDYPAVFIVDPSMNPVAVGIDQTNADGAAEYDCIPGAGAGLPWFTSQAGSPPPGYADSLPFGQNVPGATLPLGQFNYVLFYEGVGTPGDPVPNVNPTLRIQVGPDIDGSGTVINNTFRPLPTTITDVSTFTSLPGGGNAFAAPGVIDLSFSGLSNLGSKQYHVWLFDGSSYSAAPGTVTIDDTDQSGTATFQSPGVDAAITVKLDDATGVDFGANTHVVISAESGAASSPSAARLLSKEYLTASKSLEEGAFTFGSFDGGVARAYLIAGGGTGEFYGDSLIVKLSRISQPPLGFHYQSYLLGLQGPNVTASQRLHVVELDNLGNGDDRIAVGETGSGFGSYNSWAMILEPDGSEVLTAMRSFQSDDYKGKFASFFGQP